METRGEFLKHHDGQTPHSLYSFNENFDGSNGQLQRKLFGNQWVQKENGQWKELTQASFSYDATGKAGDRIDYGGGAENGKFYLWNGGFQKRGEYEMCLTTAANQRPVVGKNTRQCCAIGKDRQMIFTASEQTIDTTGNNDGVYYQIWKKR